MSNGKFYGMVTVKSSSNYTELALKSFFQHTIFEPNDQFVLIDNDGDWINNHHDNAFSTDNIIVNENPINTSGNINQLIKLANENKQDIVFLSNDVVFTPYWYTRFIPNALTIPSCNQTHFYDFPQSLSMEEFDNRYELLNKVSEYHMLTNNVPYERILMPTYVCCIPYDVYDTIGLFDEDFNVGGEDVDYRIRCLKNNFDVKYSNSYILHFNGKSSWNGAETNIQTTERDNKYKTKFIEKYGEDLANLCLASGNPYSIIQKYNLQELIKEYKFNEAIMEVLTHAQRY